MMIMMMMMQLINDCLKTVIATTHLCLSLLLFPADFFEPDAPILHLPQ